LTATATTVPKQLKAKRIAALEAQVQAQNKALVGVLDELSRSELLLAIMRRTNEDDGDAGDDAADAVTEDGGGAPADDGDVSMRRFRGTAPSGALTLQNWSGYAAVAAVIYPGQGREPRPGQEEALTALAQGRDVVAVLPTGGGKTDVLAFPGFHARSGITVVVEPLVAIVKQAVERLNSLGATAVDTTSAGPADAEEKEEDDDVRPADDAGVFELDVHEVRADLQSRHQSVLTDATDGKVVFYYVTPERLVAREDAGPRARLRAGKECEIPNFKGSSLGHFPLVSADFWTSDHLSERSRSVNAFPGARARGTLTLKRR